VVLVWVLIVLASILAFVSSLTVWTKRQMLNTDAFTNSASQVLADPTVRAAISARLVNLLYERVDVQGAIKEQLPPAAQSAAPAIAAGIETAAPRAIDAFLATAQAQALWEQLVRRAHHSLVLVLEGKSTKRLSTANGTVTLDVRPLITRIADRLGLANRLNANASPTTGQIVLLQSDQLKAAQDGVRVLHYLSSFLVIVVFALYALAIWLARGRRRTFLEITGGSLVLVGLLLLIARRVIGNYIVDSLVKTDASRPAVRISWLIETHLMRDIAVALIVYGLAAIVAGFLAGPSRAATALRRWLAPAFREHPIVVWGVAAALILIVLAWGPNSGSRRLLGTVILAALFVLGVELLRRQTLEEYPPGTAAGPSLRLPRRSQEPAAAPPDDTLTGLERLTKLRADGSLTDEEFEAQKKALLGE
jgi:hypothetical protein